MRLSPFGMDECCICDSADVRYAIPTEREEFLPYCEEHARELKQEFPDSKLYMFVPREQRPPVLLVEVAE